MSEQTILERYAMLKREPDGSVNRDALNRFLQDEDTEATTLHVAGNMAKLNELYKQCEAFYPEYIKTNPPNQDSFILRIGANMQKKFRKKG